MSAKRLSPRCRKKMREGRMARRMPASRAIPLLLALAASSLLATASPGRPPHSDSTTVDRRQSGQAPEKDIIVTGTRNLKEPAQKFVKTVTVETDEQIAKFQNEVCPAVYGMPQAYVDVIVDRMRTVARDSGLPVADKDCGPNVIVMVADDARDLVNMMRTERRLAFNKLELSAIRRLVQGERTVRSWHTMELRGADGRPMQSIEFAGRLVPAITGVLPSRIQKSVRHDLELAFVIFDLSAIDGLSLQQIADHAAMRAFARTSIEPATLAGQSILTMFSDIRQDNAPAGGLTEWDAAYLKALYATNNTVSASMQRANMARLVRSEVREAERPE